MNGTICQVSESLCPKPTVTVSHNQFTGLNKLEVLSQEHTAALISLRYDIVDVVQFFVVRYFLLLQSVILYTSRVGNHYGAKLHSYWRISVISWQLCSSVIYYFTTIHTKKYWVESGSYNQGGVRILVQFSTTKIIKLYIIMK